MASAEEKLRLWNLNFSCIDAKHDSERIVRKTRNPVPGEPDISIVIDSLIKNPLFIRSLTLMNRRAITSRDLFNVTGLPLPISNRGDFLRREGIRYGIHDMYSLEELEQQITPSYYFDSARRHYTANESINIGRWFRNNGGQKVVDLYAVGAIELPGSTLTITNNPRQLQFNFNIPGIAPYFINIDLIGGWCTDNCEYITSNWEKNSWFRDNVVAGNPQEGLKYLLGKLMGDYLHCILCGPDDVVLTGDSYLRERCVKNNKNVICRYFEKIGTNYILYKAGSKVDALYGGAVKEKMRKLTKGIKERLGFAGKTYAKRGTARIEEHTDEDSSIGPNIIVSIPEVINKIRRSPRLRGYIPVKKIEGGGIEENTEINNQYLSTLFDILGDRSIKLKEVLGHNLIKINNTDYSINDTIKMYLANLIEFLNSDILKTQLELIDKSQDNSEYTLELSKWVPSNIFYSPSEMSTSLHKSEIYYTPQQVTKIFPYQNNYIDTFQNDFAEGTFFDFVVHSIPELNGFAKGPIISINSKLDYTETISYLSEFYQDECNELREGINDSNNQMFMDILNRAVLYHEFKDLDIVKIIVKGLIEDDIVAARVFDMLINILVFKGVYIYNYQIILEFINIINNEGAGLEFIGGAQRLDNILFRYETSDILSEDFIGDLVDNKYDDSQIEELIKIIGEELNKAESNPVKRKRLNNGTYRSRIRMNTPSLVAVHAGRRKIKARTRKNKSKK